jgi:hypothetical protein
MLTERVVSIKRPSFFSVNTMMWMWACGLEALWSTTVFWSLRHETSVLSLLF